MRLSLRTVAKALGVIAFLSASAALTQDSDYCKAYTPAGQREYRELRHFLSLTYPERLVRQIDVIPRCPECMHVARGFAIESVYAGSDRVETQSWSPREEMRHLDMLQRGVIKKFRIRYRGDTCYCCDYPARSQAAWIDGPSIYPPPPDLTEVRKPAKPDRIVRGAYPPPWRQAHASCAACQGKADKRNAIAQELHDLQVERVDVVFDYATANAEALRWSERWGELAEIPEVEANKAEIAKGMAEARAGQAAALEKAETMDARLKVIDAKLSGLPAQLAAADADLAGCEATSCHVTAAGPGRSPIPPAALTDAVLAEINAARANPAAYADRLRQFRAYYHGKLLQEPGHGVGVLTNEGVAAIDDAIAYLMRQKPMPALEPSAALARSAARYAADAGPAGLTGHVGTDGSTMPERMRAVGIWAGASAEDIALGYDRAAAIVRQLIIDDGVATRGHRTAIFDPGLTIAGVGCGPHKIYRFMCVVDFAGALMAR